MQVFGSHKRKRDCRGILEERQRQRKKLPKPVLALFRAPQLTPRARGLQAPTHPQTLPTQPGPARRWEARARAPSYLLQVVATQSRAVTPRAAGQSRVEGPAHRLPAAQHLQLGQEPPVPSFEAPRGVPVQAPSSPRGAPFAAVPKLGVSFEEAQRHGQEQQLKGQHLQHRPRGRLGCSGTRGGGGGGAEGAPGSGMGCGPRRRRPWGARRSRGAAGTLETQLEDTATREPGRGIAGTRRCLRGGQSGRAGDTVRSGAGGGGRRRPGGERSGASGGLGSGWARSGGAAGPEDALSVARGCSLGDAVAGPGAAAAAAGLARMLRSSLPAAAASHPASHVSLPLFFFFLTRARGGAAAARPLTSPRLPRPRPAWGEGRGREGGGSGASAAWGAPQPPTRRHRGGAGRWRGRRPGPGAPVPASRARAGRGAGRGLGVGWGRATWGCLVSSSRRPSPLGRR